MKEIILWDLKLQIRPLLMLHCSIAPTLAMLIFSNMIFLKCFFLTEQKILSLKKASFLKKFYFLTLLVPSTLPQCFFAPQ